MNLILKISIITLISIAVANTVSSYAIAFVGDEQGQLPGIGSFEDCGNGVDDDGDGLIDGADSLDC
jgi:hypothetical protein